MQHKFVEQEHTCFTQINT